MKRVTRVNPGFVLISASAIALVLVACVKEGDDAPPLPGALGPTMMAATAGAAGAAGAGMSGAGGGGGQGGSAGGGAGGQGGSAGSGTLPDAGTDAGDAG